MNYYLQWWENARNNTGIWTKKTYQDYLEQRIKDLETGTEAQAYLTLETENTNLKEKLAKAKKEITDSDNIVADLAKENEEKEQAKNQAESELLKVQTNYKQLAVLTGKSLKDQQKEYETKLATAQANQANLLKDNLFKETRIKELQQSGDKILIQLENEKAKFQKDYEELIVDLQHFLGKYKVANFKELDKRINYQVQEINNQNIRLERLDNQLKDKDNKSQQIQVLFANIIEVIKKNTTFILRGGKDIKSAIIQIQETMGWEKTILPEFTGSTTSLSLNSKEKELEKKLTELTEDNKTLQQEIRALKLDKEDLINKLNSASVPTTPILKPVPKISKKLEKWKNISPNFTEDLIKHWEKIGLKEEKVREWINIGLTVNDANLVNWLIKIKKGNYAKPDWLLNHGNLEQLRQEFKVYDNK